MKIKKWRVFGELNVLLNNAVDSRLRYHADAAFCHLVLFSYPKERRHAFGLISWLPYYCFSTIRAKLSKMDASPDLMNCFLFNDISTPAHYESWHPIWSVLRLKHPDLEILRIRPLSYEALAHQNNRSFLVLYVSRAKELARAMGSFFELLKAVRCNRSLFLISLKRSSVIIEYFCHFHRLLAGFMRLPLSSTCFITTYELDPGTKALVLSIRKYGGRIIHVMHGQRLPTYQVTMATDLVLFSKIDEPWFRKRVDSSIRIWTVGHPRLEEIRKQVGSIERHEGSVPRITFFSQPVEGDYTRKLRIADWKLLRMLAGKADLRFRAHPREEKADLRADMAEAGIEFAQISEAGLVEDLKWSDAVASSWSTVSMEAAACGRGIFWTCSTPERYEASQELRDHGIGVLISSADQWQGYIDQWKAGGWETPIVVPKERLKELGMIGDLKKSWIDRLELVV